MKTSSIILTCSNDLKQCNCYSLFLILKSAGRAEIITIWETTHTDPLNVEQIKSLHHLSKSTSINFNSIIIVLILSITFPIACPFKCEFPFNSRPKATCCFAWYPLLTTLNFYLLPLRSLFPPIPPICECRALTTDQIKCPVSLLCKQPQPPLVFLCGDLPRSQSPSWLPPNDSPKMVGCEDAGQ